MVRCKNLKIKKPNFLVIMLLILNLPIVAPTKSFGKEMFLLENSELAQPESCELLVSTNEIVFEKGGSTTNFTISSNDNWSIEYDFPTTLGFSLTSGEAGEDISISVAAPENTSIFSVSGSIIITSECGGEQTISLSQYGVCNLLVSTRNIEFENTGSMEVFTLESADSWDIDYLFPTVLDFSLTILEAGKSFSVSVKAPENTSGKLHSGSITLTNDCGAEQTIFLSQPTICNLNVAENNIEFNAMGSTENLTISSNAKWSIDYDFAGLLEFSTVSGDTDENISISVTAPENSFPNSISGTITITNDCGTQQIISISQPGNCKLFVLEDNITFESNGSIENFTLIPF